MQQINTDDLLMMIGIREVEKFQARKQLEEVSDKVRRQANELGALQEEVELLRSTLEDRQEKELGTEDVHS